MGRRRIRQEAGIARITIHTGEVTTLFNHLAASVDLQGGVGQEIAAILRADALRQFQSAGEPGWAPLSPLTIARKAALGYPRLNRFGLIPDKLRQNGQFGPSNILIMTGALLSSWTDQDDPHHVEEILADSVSIGSDLAYAPTHQYGRQATDDDQGHRMPAIPARPIRITPAGLEAVVDLLTQMDNQ